MARKKVETKGRPAGRPRVLADARRVSINIDAITDDAARHAAHLDNLSFSQFVRVAIKLATIKTLDRHGVKPRKTSKDR